ncbi:D-glycerate dehydrogenase [Vibrio fluvialis]|uniref:2-hydroxyacid dehydrogenase n=1 Tax=Vibrio fluvialis TaxID=676 RepID=UPI001EEA4AAA|nr:D-glycerate dehydrogenase [Vibrio fluvialis]EKO3380882.1 D-glycerate dehydrogenase [Vibrio fluvialis]MCG6372857.1 D-glycerate dehydrogenase [Vibrio fluvialis]
MKPQVVLYKSLPPAELAKLQSHFDVIEFDGINDDNRAEFAQALTRAEGTIGTGVMMSADLLDRAPKLKAMATISVGIDQFDVDYLSQRGIPLIHTPGVLNETVADTVILLALGAARRAGELSAIVKQGRWTQNLTEAHFGVDFHGKTLGIIGMGRIGYAVAKRAHYGFGMPICYHNRSVNVEAEQDFSAQRMDLEDLLQIADFIVVLVPLSPETEHLIGDNEFNLMKPSAVFINAARGKVVDEPALIRALQTGAIRAAGLDVFQTEPLPATSPLTQLDNVFLLPHIGSATHETRLSMVQCAVDSLIAAMQGDYSDACANRKQLEQTIV